MSSGTIDANLGTWSYRPGDWFAVFGSRTTLLLPVSEKPRVVAAWAAIDDGALFDDVLDSLLAAGLGALPAFVLVGGPDPASVPSDGGVTRILVRGDGVHATMTSGAPSAAETVDVVGPSGATWAERSLADVVSLSVTLPGADVDVPASDLPIDAGLVRVSRVDRPPVSPVAVEPATEPEGLEPEQSVAPVEPPQPVTPPAYAGWSLPPDPAQLPAPPFPPSFGGDLAAPSEPADIDVLDAPTDLPPPYSPPPYAPVGPPSEPPPPPPPSFGLEPSPLDGDAETTDTPPPPPYPLPPEFPEADAAPVDDAEAELAATDPDPAEDALPDLVPPPPPAGVWGDDPAPAPLPAPAAPVSADDHDGLTSAGVGTSEFVREQPGIPGQPMAPEITPASVARLTVSTGETYDVDRVILVGRAPEARRFTTTEQPILITVPSPLHEISSTHLEIRPGSGADHGSAVVTDMGSTNGTLLEQPGLGAEELKPGIAVQLLPGATINLGDGVTISVTRP